MTMAQVQNNSETRNTMMSLPPSVSSSDASWPPSLPGGFDLPPSVRTEHRSQDDNFQNDDSSCDVSGLMDVSAEASWLSLPPDVEMFSEGESETDMCFVLDEDDDIQTSLDELNEFLLLRGDGPERRSVLIPTPADAQLLVGHHHAAEFYSQPRVAPVIQALGLQSVLSCDLLTGWDFEVTHCAQLSVDLLDRLMIDFLILSPPCTVFSELQRLWNFKRMHPAKVQAMWRQGMLHLVHSIRCARRQLASDRLFVLEHPARASSWQTEEMKSLAAQPNVHSVVFDQCMTGLVSKVLKKPMRKRTRLLTNSVSVVRAFQGLRCDRSHTHQTIQGSEGGVRRSTHAQCYPPPMVDRLARCCQEEIFARMS